MSEEKNKRSQTTPLRSQSKIYGWFIAEDSQRISWTPFVIVGLVLAIAIAAASSLTPKFSGAYILGGMMALAVAIVVFQKPELGAYFLIITVFTNMSDLFTERGLPSINQPLIALIYISIFANYVIRTGNLSQFPRLSRVEWALASFYVVIVLSSFLTITNNSSLYTILDVTKDILVGLAIFIALNSKEKWQRGMWTLIIVISTVSFLGVLKMAIGTDFTFGGLAQLSALGQVGDNGELRYGGPIGAANIWGQVLSAALPLVAYRLLKAKNALLKMLLLFSTIFIFLAVIYTGSRGALVALIAILPFIAIERRIKLPSVLFGLTAITILLLLLPTSYTKRITSLSIFFNQEDEYSLSQDDSIEGRRNAMLTGIAMFKANPFLGVGFGNFGKNYWDYAAKEGLDSAASSTDEGGQQQAHSLYVEIVSEMGLFGIATFTTFFGSILIGLFKTRKKKLSEDAIENWSNWMTATFMAILTFLISGIFLHGILWRYIWILIGLSMAGLALSEARYGYNTSFKTPQK